MAILISKDVRSRMMRGIAAGKSTRAVARQFEVAPSTASRLKRHVEQTGSIAPRPQGKPKGSGKLEPYRDFLIARVLEKPDITMPELARVLQAENDVTADPSTLSKLLCAAGFTHKKCIVRPFIAREFGYHLTKNSLRKCIRPLASGLLLQPGHDEIRARRFQTNLRAGRPFF